VEETAVLAVPLHAIDESDTTFRFRSDESTGSLVHGFRTDGQLEPITILAGGTTYRIIDGFRRTAAARVLGWKTIDALVHAPMLDAEARRISFVANVVRDKLTILEKTDAIRLARREGYAKAEVARMFGMSQRQIERYLALPEGILEWIDGRVITMAHARVLAGHFAAIPRERMPVLIEEIRSMRLSAHALPRWLAARGFDAVVPARRTRVAGHISSQRVRFYNMEITPSSPAEARELTLDFLRRAIRQIEGFGAVASRHAGDEPGGA
jgi:ParB/RepB/Spo0J family partition protein